MQGFVQGADRQQTTLLPECLDDWVDESNSIRAVDVFVEALDLRDLGFEGVDPAATGRPAYHPSPMLKLYIYGYLNRVQSSRRLEREAGRNVEVVLLTKTRLKEKLAKLEEEVKRLTTCLNDRPASRLVERALRAEAFLLTPGHPRLLQS